MQKRQQSLKKTEFDLAEIKKMAATLNGRLPTFTEAQELSQEISPAAASQVYYRAFLLSNFHGEFWRKLHQIKVEKTQSDLKVVIVPHLFPYDAHSLNIAHSLEKASRQQGFECETAPLSTALSFLENSARLRSYLEVQGKPLIVVSVGTGALCLRWAYQLNLKHARLTAWTHVETSGSQELLSNVDLNWWKLPKLRDALQKVHPVLRHELQKGSPYWQTPWPDLPHCIKCNIFAVGAAVTDFKALAMQSLPKAIQIPFLTEGPISRVQVEPLWQRLLLYLHQDWQKQKASLSNATSRVDTRT